MNDVIVVFIFSYISVLVLVCLTALYFFLRFEAVIICPEKVASKLQKEWDFANCEHKSKFVGWLNNRYIEKCEDCGELLVEEYAETLSKYV